ncbi:hypothetical protein ACPYPG_08285 [Streptomyces sp. FR-108]|uniref:hypothetical protein n=1 Tax=Streptomyces sp. FR-108 TaxID=3416665 RepID=UPI003CF559CF
MFLNDLDLTTDETLRCIVHVPESWTYYVLFLDDPSNVRDHLRSTMGYREDMTYRENYALRHNMVAVIADLTLEARQSITHLFSHYENDPRAAFVATSKVFQDNKDVNTPDLPPTPEQTWEEYQSAFWARDARAHAAGTCTLTNGCAYSDHSAERANS